MSNINVVCFDLGGVLAHVAKDWQEAIVAAGSPSDGSRATPFEALPAFKLYQAGQLDIEAYLDEVADFLNVSAADALKVHEHILIRPTDGTEEIIRELHAAGVRTGCLSNTNALHWPVLLDENRFPNIALLQMKAASQLIGFNKPDPEAFRAFEGMADAKPTEILFFEDGPHNIEGAKACGWNAVLIDPSGDQNDQIRSALRSFGVFKSG